MQRIRIIDSHTGGEPTRLVLEGGPDLGSGSLTERVNLFRSQFDRFRTAIVNEPRGSDVIVGGLLCHPSDTTCVAGIIFFNNVGYLGMCGHGLIGVVRTLYHCKRIDIGSHRFETPVGIVQAQLNADLSVSITNVPSYRVAHDVSLTMASGETVQADIAWGGNWFALVDDPQSTLSVENVKHLTQRALDIRDAAHLAGYPEVDHVELFGKTNTGANSRSFVLCPGNAYDRSPCGTGTSAKLACLAASGKLKPHQQWIQESVIGSQFKGSFEWHDEQQTKITPTITGIAHISAEADLIIDSTDPFAWGIT